MFNVHCAAHFNTPDCTVTDTLDVTVNNVAPTVDADVGADDSVDEGALYSYTSSFTDPGFDCINCLTEENFTATIDWGDGTIDNSAATTESDGSPGTPTTAAVLTTGTVLGSHTYADEGSYTVTGTVTEETNSSMERHG